ncbi:MAG: hypothetical protein WD851_20420 [Pirellulales bacterium]
MEDHRLTGGVRIGVLGVTMLVVLRMCIGAHFFSEGTKKLEPGFSSAGFLQGAKGPLAPYFRSFAPTFHEWDQLLAVPRQSPEYVSRSLPKAPELPEELLEPQREEIRLPADSPAAAWGNRVLHDWEQTLEKFAKTPGLSEEQQKQAEAAFLAVAGELKDYLAEVGGEISEYQHELWRLAQWEAEEASGELPFLDSRIAVKRAETSGTPRQWANTVEQMEIRFASDLRDLLTEEQQDSALAMKHVNSTLQPSSWLSLVDRSVTVLTIGAGLCLLFGFFTRLGALAAAAFLLSVMATQPPWVPGVDATYFWYQLVEFTALLTLAAVGAGRWAGIDAIIHGLWNGCCRSTQKPPVTPA